MKVYRVQGDVTSYSIVDCRLSFAEKLNILKPFREFGGMKDTWKPLACAKLGNDPLESFAEFNLVGGMPVVFSEVLTKRAIATFFEASGELLPITVEAASAFALNVTRTVEACDYEKSRIHSLPDGRPATNWPVFKKQAISSVTGLFRIKEAQSCLYLAEPLGGAGFYAMYQEHGLSGLNFEEQPLS
jgi:hypothetical protein